MFPPSFSADASTWKLAERLSALDKSEDIAVFGPKVVEIMQGAGYRFSAIDEHEMYFDQLQGRFYMLRQVRNHPVWAPRLFAAIRGERARPETWEDIANRNGGLKID